MPAQKQGRNESYQEKSHEENPAGNPEHEQLIALPRIFPPGFQNQRFAMDKIIQEHELPPWPDPEHNYRQDKADH